MNFLSYMVGEKFPIAGQIFIKTHENDENDETLPNTHFYDPDVKN